MTHVGNGSAFPNVIPCRPAARRAVGRRHGTHAPRRQVLEQRLRDCLVRGRCPSATMGDPEFGGVLANIADFRCAALALPEASEGAHMGHPDFRVRNKIFAPLGVPDAAWGMVKLTPEQQEMLMAAEPAPSSPPPAPGAAAAPPTFASPPSIAPPYAARSPWPGAMWRRRDLSPNSVALDIHLFDVYIVCITHRCLSCSLNGQVEPRGHPCLA